MKDVLSKVERYNPLNNADKLVRDFLIYSYIVTDTMDPARVAILVGLSEQRTTHIAESIVRMSLTQPKRFEMWYEAAKYVQELYGQYSETLLNKEA